MGVGGCPGPAPPFKMHQRGSVKKGNMGIGNPFFKSMRVIWTVLSHFKITHKYYAH